MNLQHQVELKGSGRNLIQDQGYETYLIIVRLIHCIDFLYEWLPGWLTLFMGKLFSIRYAAKILAETWHKTWGSCICMRYPSQVVIYYETYKNYEKFHIIWASLGIKLRGIDRWESRGKQTRHFCIGRSSILKSRLLPRSYMVKDS